MKHLPLILGAVIAIVGLVMILSGCGGEGEADQVADALRGTDHADELHFDPLISPKDLNSLGGLSDDLRSPDGDQLGRPSSAQLVLFGEQEGRRARTAGNGLTKKTGLSKEEQKHLTCFLVEKALDHDFPQTPEGVAGEAGEYLGEEVADRIPAYKYARASEVLWEVAEELEFDDAISKKTALELLCG